ncbi:MAG: TlpA disulfide reductase family protein [Polyangiales bacterium]
MQKLAWSLALAMVASVASAEVHERALESGTWDGVVHANEVDVPFRFELRLDGKRAEGAFFNGDERVRSSAGSVEGDRVTLEFAHYASRLEATWAGGILSGTYQRPNAAAYPLRAQPHVAPARSAGKAPSIAGEWEVAVKSPKGEDAWRLFVRQAGNEASAAILRVDGDTGTLSGSHRDGKFVLSHFSGARPTLLEITPGADGTLNLVQNGSATYVATKVAQARAKNLPAPADPSRWTSVKDPNQPLRFAGKDLAGNDVTNADARFVGKVVLVNVMGSWCPNCHDEAPFLAKLDKKYGKRGLEVVALSFEDAEQLANPTRLRAFVDTYGVRYTVLRAGEPKQIAEKLPDAVNLNTWPATFFIGRDGRVRGAHAGFAGKATGEVNRKLEAELTRTVEGLLAEKAR